MSEDAECTRFSEAVDALIIKIRAGGKPTVESLFPQIEDAKRLEEAREIIERIGTMGCGCADEKARREALEWLKQS